jgi:hypothetical protein
VAGAKKNEENAVNSESLLDPALLTKELEDVRLASKNLQDQLAGLQLENESLKEDQGRVANLSLEADKQIAQLTKERDEAIEALNKVDPRLQSMPNIDARELRMLAAMTVGGVTDNFGVPFNDATFDQMKESISKQAVAMARAIAVAIPG